MEVKIALSLEKALPQSVSKSLWSLCTEVVSQLLWKRGWDRGRLQLRPKVRSQQRLQGSWFLSQPQFPRFHSPVPTFPCLLTPVRLPASTED